MPEPTLGQQLRSAREAAGLTREAMSQLLIAQNLGLSVGYVEALEDDCAPTPSVGWMVRIAAALNLPPHTFALAHFRAQWGEDAEAALQEWQNPPPRTMLDSLCAEDRALWSEVVAASGGDADWGLTSHEDGPYYVRVPKSIYQDVRVKAYGETPSEAFKAALDEFPLPEPPRATRPENV